jgi:hypothetical protein
MVQRINSMIICLHCFWEEKEKGERQKWRENKCRLPVTYSLQLDIINFYHLSIVLPAGDCTDYRSQ